MEVKVEDVEMEVREEDEAEKEERNINSKACYSVTPVFAHTSS